jgi:hypothetical protein
MSASQPFSSWVAAAPVQTDALPPPLPKWAVYVLLAPIAAGYYLDMDVDSISGLVHQTRLPFLVVGALVFLLAVIALGRWVYGRILYRRHPLEPWLWDRPWPRVLRDDQLSRVVGGLIGCLLIVLVMSLFHALVWFESIRKGYVLQSVFLCGFFLVIDVIVFMGVMLPVARKVLALLRFGRMRLRLPGVPLTPGSQNHVHLVARPSLARLSEVKVELRRVREWSETRGSGKERRTHTVRQTEYSQTQRVDAEALRAGGDLRIPLELPEVAAENSTVIHGSRRCFWELLLASEVPGVDLDATFELPVYHFAGVDSGQGEG